MPSPNRPTARVVHAAALLIPIALAGACGCTDWQRDDSPPPVRPAAPASGDATGADATGADTSGSDAATADDPAISEATAWGDAHDGLRLGLALAADAGGGLRATVSLRNDSDAPLVLAGLAEMWSEWLRFEQADGTAFVASSGVFICADQIVTERLAPHDTWTRTYRLDEVEGQYLRQNPDRQPGDEWDYRDELPAGEWTVTVTYAPDSTGHPGAWTGKLVSGAVRVTTD